MCDSLQKAVAGARGRILLDRGQFKKPSCAKQAARLQERHESGVEMRILKPGERVRFYARETLDD
eukprot:4600593-Heterocapsa_arctica.AAC.1